MGTSNFHNVNAKKIYSFGFYEDEDYNDLYLDEIRYFSERLENIGYYSSNNKPSSELRSFPCQVLGEKTLNFKIKDNECEIKILAFSRAGYYEGGNLDYEIEFNINCDSFDEILLKRSFFNIQLKKWYDFNDKQLKQLYNKFSKKFAIMQTEIEGLYTELTQPLTVLAKFSNGETIYKKIK